MTIISPQARTSAKSFFVALFCLLLIGGGIYVFTYNTFVAQRHAVSDLEERIVRARAANADFKGGLYRLLDPARLEAVAVDQGLLLERKPEYLTISLSQ